MARKGTVDLITKAEESLSAVHRRGGMGTDHIQ